MQIKKFTNDYLNALTLAKNVASEKIVDNFIPAIFLYLLKLHFILFFSTISKASYLISVIVNPNRRLR
jgi:hypothetical protein